MFGPDPVIKDYMGLVSKFLTSSQTGVTSDANKPVNIVAWDTFDETIDLTGNLIEGEYYYFPAAPNDQIRVKNGSTKSTVYSICYTELLAFIAAYNEQRFTSIETRLAALESS